MSQFQQLNSTERENLQKLWDADYSTILNDRDGSVPFLKYLFELHFKIFGETCSNCPAKIAGYIQKIKNLKIQEMSKTGNTPREFKLNEQTVIQVAGTSEAYSDHNLTDEKAVELLAANPNRKSLFSKMPENVDELISNYSKGKKSTSKKSTSKEVNQIEVESVEVSQQA